MIEPLRRYRVAGTENDDATKFEFEIAADDPFSAIARAHRYFDKPSLVMRISATPLDDKEI